MEQPYTIAGLAKAAGVHVETIRYYQRRRLVPEPKKPAGGVRRYDDSDAERLRFIKRAQEMGFTLKEMSSLLRLWDRRSCDATRKVAVAKLEELDARILKLRRLRGELARLVGKCESNADDARCPVIESLSKR